MDKTIFDKLKGLNQEDAIKLLTKWVSDNSMSDLNREKMLDSIKKFDNSNHLKLYIDTLLADYPDLKDLEIITKLIDSYKCEVPRELRGEKIEKFWEMLEKSTMLDGRKEKRILNRSGYYWVFATKALAAYIASKLYDFGVVTPYASIEQVAHYNPQSLQKSLTKSPYPRGAAVVDKIILSCK